MKCVIRFAYYQPSDWPDDGGIVTEPPAARILLHVGSLANVLQQWTHAIIALQTGFIGPWGEGHSSTHFRCSAAEGGVRQIIAALVDAVPGRSVQIRYPSLKKTLFFPEKETDMTVITSNVILNGDLETVDTGPTGASSWSAGVGSSAGLELTNADSISGNSINVSAGNSAYQGINLSAAQGAQGNIIKIFGSSKIYNPPSSLPGETDYSIYVDVQMVDHGGTNTSNIYGQVASFCGSGEWEYAATYLEVPTGKIITSLFVHLMYRGTTEGYALFDDVGIAIFEPYSLQVTGAMANDGSDISMLGHHNDCFLASDTDLGTYN